MNAAAVKAVLSLINQIAVTTQALQAISEMIKHRQSQGQDVTLDDLKELQLADDRAADALAQAIDEAEDA